MHLLIHLAVAFFTMTSLAQAASSSYIYTNGDKLNFELQSQGYIGIKDLLTLEKAAPPFNFSTVHHTHGTNKIKKKQHVAAIQKMEEYVSAFQASASIYGSYDGISGSASASYLYSQTLKSTSSLYIWFYDFRLTDVLLSPDVKLSQDAEQLLLTNPQQFVKNHGLWCLPWLPSIQHSHSDC